jgi:predicted Fe-Mo cluster-binding NifX family protein
MGEGAYGNLKRLGIEPVLTDARRVDEAALRYALGDLPSLDERIHTGADHDHHPD